jgi:hypothetical protein
VSVLPGIFSGDVLPIEVVPSIQMFEVDDVRPIQISLLKI